MAWRFYTPCDVNCAYLSHIFYSNWPTSKREKKYVRAKLGNYESEDHRLQYFRIKKKARVNNIDREIKAAKENNHIHVWSTHGSVEFFLTEIARRFLRSFCHPKKVNTKFITTAWVVYVYSVEKSVFLGIVVVIVFELSLRSVNKVAVKLQVPFASNIPTTRRPTRVTATTKLLMVSGR